MWVLAFFVNGPHFLISYEIFYGGHFSKILKSPRFFFAGIVVPLVLLGVIVFGFVQDSSQLFSGLLYSMFFFVGWHYVKQAYGCFIVYSGGQGVYFSKLEQCIVRYSLFPLWWVSFLKLFTGKGQVDYWGLKYATFSLLSNWADLIYAASFLGVVPLLGLFIARSLSNKKLPSLTAVTPLLVIYLWLSPLLSHHFFFYMIPFFHSLQYLLFSGVFTRNKVEHSGRGVVEGHLLWWGGAFVLAALAFYLIPKGLDGMALHSGEITPNLFLLSFILFINIHHYFIDNVIWRGDNPQVREFVRMRSNVRDGQLPAVAR